jgi:hypothetical protein
MTNVLTVASREKERIMKRMQLVVMTVLAFLLTATVMWAILVWNLTSVEMSIRGSIAIGLGTFFSLVIGSGLLALMFYSSRNGYDEAADSFRKRFPKDPRSGGGQIEPPQRSAT